MEEGVGEVEEGCTFGGEELIDLAEITGDADCLDPRIARYEFPAGEARSATSRSEKVIRNATRISDAAESNVFISR